MTYSKLLCLPARPEVCLAMEEQTVPLNATSDL